MSEPGSSQRLDVQRAETRYEQAMSDWVNAEENYKGELAELSAIAHVGESVAAQLGLAFELTSVAVTGIVAGATAAAAAGGAAGAATGVGVAAAVAAAGPAAAAGAVAAVLGTAAIVLTTIVDDENQAADVRQQADVTKDAGVRASEAFANLTLATDLYVDAIVAMKTEEQQFFGPSSGPPVAPAAGSAPVVVGPGSPTPSAGGSSSDGTDAGSDGVDSGGVTFDGAATSSHRDDDSSTDSRPTPADPETFDDGFSTQLVEPAGGDRAPMTGEATPPDAASEGADEPLETGTASPTPRESAGNEAGAVGQSSATEDVVGSQSAPDDSPQKPSNHDRDDTHEEPKEPWDAGSHEQPGGGFEGFTGPPDAGGPDSGAAGPAGGQGGNGPPDSNGPDPGEAGPDGQDGGPSGGYGPDSGEAGPDGGPNTADDTGDGLDGGHDTDSMDESD